MRPRPDRRWLTAASGFVFAASTPPLDLQVGILIGLAGFAWSFAPKPDEEGPPAYRGAGRGFYFGLAANVLALRFVPAVIHRFTGLPLAAGLLALVLLAAMQSLPWVVGGAVGRWLYAKGIVPRWLAFALAVYVATFVPAIFPWTPAGGLSRWPLLLQTADLVGERGVSFVVAAACALLVEYFHEGARTWKLPAIGVAIFACLIAHGLVRRHRIDGERAAAPNARIALVQPDFDALFFWEKNQGPLMMERLTAYTRQAEKDGATLTVWPESAYPYTLDHDTRTSPLGSKAILQRRVHGPVLTGAYMKKKSGAGTNAAIFVGEDGAIAPPYDKRHLLWFGETIPLGDVLPFLNKIFSRGTGLDPGTESIAFTTGNVRAAVLNCYEDTLPVAGREALAVSPNLLVNVTNDSWFYGTAESELHLRMAVLRAIETRRDLVRAVNRGPTSWVDASGRIQARTETPGPLLVDPALLEGKTLYVMLADWPLALILIGVVAIRYRRHKTTTAPLSEESDAEDRS